MKICIDAGHGGGDTGAVGPTFLKEKDVNLKVALFLGDILKLNGIEVVFTRTTDTRFGNTSNESLSRRVKIANESGSDYFISIHCNSAENRSANGTEVFIYNERSKAKDMAEKILNQIVNTMGFRDRGVKTANFYVIKYTTMPACLIEIAFISNPNEEKILADEKNQRKIALCIAKGIGEALGINIVEYKKGKVNAKAGLNVRKGPSTQYPIVKVLKYGEEIKIYAIEDGWYKIDDGWVYGQYVDLV
ncbi:MAG: N-acetylmuramoyl-L-alanine amidase [Caloramator sp.]|nr:N-acetylmuramoyl-L-alanine amidase [Caloramator sp.]